MNAVMDRPQTPSGHRCEGGFGREGCNQPATHQVRMPGWPVVNVCQEHAEQAKRMNFDVEPIK
jgi:hypothetical protein